MIDPFGGSGTTAVAAFQAGRSCVLIDNNGRYCLKAEQRLRTECDLNVTITPRPAAKRVRSRRLQAWPTVGEPELRRLAV